MDATPIGNLDATPIWMQLFNSPKIRDGSTIVVNSKEQTEPLKPTELASSLASLLSSLVTIILLVNQLSASP